MSKDFQPLDELNVNGRVYVDKQQLLALIRSEKEKWMAGTEVGYLESKKGRRIAAMLSLNRLGVLLCRRFYDKLHEDMGKYLIVCLSEENGTLLYFRGFCYRVSGREGEAVMSFTEDPGDAMLFDDFKEADIFIEKACTQFPGKEIISAPYSLTLSRKGLSCLHTHVGWPANRDREDVLNDEIRWRRKPE